MRIYLKNITVKLHPDPIWNDGAFGLFGRESRRLNNKKNKNKTSRVMYEISSWS